VTQEARVELGRVVGAHALRGELRVRIFGDSPENLLRQGSVWLAEQPGDPNGRRFTIVGAGQGRTGEIRLALEGIGSREAALALRGMLVLAEPGELAPLDEGDYYWHELIGCTVETSAGQPVGVVREIWETGSHDVLVVEPEGGGRKLIPTAREIMTEVDIAAGRIRIEDLPGLLD